MRLSNTDDLQAPPDSEAITIVGGVNYDVTMTYALMYGTITVNVSTQPAGMPIGAYTVTLTPQGGGDAMQQSGNNSQAVVFSNVKNGVVYTVGLSAINHYTANAGGTVTAVGGQNISHNAHYAFSANLADLTWTEIDAIGQSGAASSAFSIGDTKDISVSGETLTMEIYGFNHDDLTSGGKAPYTFGMKNLMANTREKTSAGNKSSSVQTDAVQIFLLSVNEVAGTQSDSWVSNNEGSRYPVFSSNASRVKKLSNGISAAQSWWLRSPRLGASYLFCNVGPIGSMNISDASDSFGVCFGFCI